jgi:DNA-binding HxlR family transcriptional regulator
MVRNKKKASLKRRSGCPLNASVEMLGDRWSLLIIRDMMLRGSCTYSEFLDCYEGIATNILADRLQKLVAYEIITAESDPSDGRKQIYFLTRKGIDLAPVLTEMVLWAAAHEKTENQQLVRQMRDDRDQFLAGVRQRWANRQSTGIGARLPDPAKPSVRFRDSASRNRPITHSRQGDRSA